MSRVLDFAIDALATHRISRLVVEDEITADVRTWVFAHHGHPSEKKLSYLITCPHCVSIWAGAAIAVAHEVSVSRPPGVVRSTLGVLRYMLALSGAVSLGHEVAGKLPTPM